MRIPFTTGILIGIGETRSERIDALFAIRDLHERYGHIQEVIVQNFRAKPESRMADAPEPSLEDHLWTVAVARLVLGRWLHVQAPPNLASDAGRLIDAGIDDWGGVSPVTIDHVNPEAPRPALSGIHPDFTGVLYFDVCAAIKAAVPGIHIHAFSPLEVTRGAATLGITIPELLARLRTAGLGSLPGTAAEILDEEVRAVLCPDKITTGEWVTAITAAQAETGGITEFVPLPFVHLEAPIYLKGCARRGPTYRETILMHAVGRLALHALIPNIQASWVKLGPTGARTVLESGANDTGGTLMNEPISRAAGAEHGQELPPEGMEALIRSIGREPRQRTTLYGTPPAEQRRRSFGAAPLQALVQPAALRWSRPGGRSAEAPS